MVQFFKAQVESNDKVSSKIYRTVIKAVEPSFMEFKAGQFINIQVLGNLRRSYSIASSPDDNSRFLLYSDIGPMGPGSRFFVNAKIGDTVDFIGPLGSFAFRESENPALFVATGTGIAPLYSMLTYELVHENKREMFLYFGCRYEEDLFLVEELKQLSDKYPNFKYMVTLSKPNENWKGAKGRVTEHIPSDIKEGDKYDVYICGGQAMIIDVKEILVSKGINPTNIYFEKFF